MMETGDETYARRKERFDYVMARRAEKPQPTLQQIGDELGISRQNVHRLVKRGEVRPSGRPRSNEGRRMRLIARLEKWQTKRLTKLQGHEPTEREDHWISVIEAELKALG